MKRRVSHYVPPGTVDAEAPPGPSVVRAENPGPRGSHSGGNGSGRVWSIRLRVLSQCTPILAECGKDTLVHPALSNLKLDLPSADGRQYISIKLLFLSEYATEIGGL